MNREAVSTAARAALARWLVGDAAPPPHCSYQLARWLFLRLLALCYLAAFASLATQVLGLMGSEGVLPVADFLAEVRAAVGPRRFLLVPTVFWLDASDATLRLVCLLGAALALLLLLGVLEAPVLLLLWALYLSIVSTGRDFLSFQWDALLLEAGLLGGLLARLRPLRPGAEPVPRLAWLLLVLLLFRLMFSSGVVKLRSGDPVWRDLTALRYHFETQPLPTWIGWWAHQLPDELLRAATAAMFVIELGVPFFVVGPRRLRHVACGLLVLLQVLIALCGNYCFFNLLTAALCVLLLDDAVLARVLPRRLRERILLPRPAARGAHLRGALLLGMAGLALLVGLTHLVGLFYRPGGRLPGPAAGLVRTLAPLHLVNHYGLFAIMTTTRPEIILEGSNDGKHWQPYEFRYKPGDPMRRPGFVAPHQPRLDWQMWFAALGPPEDSPWFGHLCLRILQGSKPVRALLAHDPFPDTPPRFLRATLYQYHFTGIAERRRTGAWWRRQEQGRYFPAVSLR